MHAVPDDSHALLHAVRSCLGLALVGIAGLVFPGRAHAFTANEGGFITAFESGMCLEPTSASAGGEIRQVTCNGASTQRFHFERMSDGSHRIRHTATSLCVDVSGGSTSNGGNLVLWSCHDAPNQRWTVDETVAHHIRLIARHSGKCMDVAGGSTTSGADVNQWDCHRGFNQEFMFLSPSYFASAHGPITTMRAVHSGKCVDVAEISTSVGGALHQWDCLGAANQAFEYVEVARNQYVIRAFHSDLCIAPENESTADGARIRQYTCSGTLGQRFRNEHLGGDAFRVVNLKSGKVLDVYYANSSNGTAMQQWSWGGAENQKFRVYRDVGDRNFCSADDPAACEPYAITSGLYGSYSDCRYGLNTGAGWYNYEYVYYDALDRCAWWHDKSCWSRNNSTGVYEGFGGCSQDVNFIACVENVQPVTAEEASARSCVVNSMLEDAADACEPFTPGRGGMYPLYNAEREGGACSSVVYSPAR